jgi:hypothetical protein
MMMEAGRIFDHAVERIRAGALPSWAMRARARSWPALATALGVALLASHADAYEVQRTKGGHAVHWQAGSVDLAIDPSLVGLAYGTADALRDAARVWSDAGGAPHVHVSSGAGADAIGAIGRNVAFFVPGGYGPAKGALAITVVTYDEGGGRILDADIVVSGGFRFGVLDANARAEGAGSRGKAVPDDTTEPEPTAATPILAPDDAFDLGHVLAHEMGHLLGLADTKDDATAVMYRMTAPNDTSRRTPNGDDVAGVRALYASTSSGCGGASVSPAPPDAGAERAALLLVLAGVLFLALRGRPRARAVLVVSLAILLVARTPAIARGARAATGQARARVVATDVDTRGPLLTTRLTLAVEECKVAHCAARSHALVWGGSYAGMTQVVGHAPAPAVGDVVELPAHAQVAEAEAAVRPALGPAFFAAR